MRLLPLILLPLFIAACDGVNSGMTTGPVPPVEQKPTACKMDFAQTCWAKTVETITDCLKKTAAVGTDLFSADKEFCSNSASNKLVQFRSPADIFTNPIGMFHDQELNFKVYPDSINECFNVTGTKDNFTVEIKKTGEKVSFKYDKTAMSFNCLDGQDVSISTDKIAGCQNVMANTEFNDQVPGFVFEPIVENGLTKGWSFRFRGATNSPDVFKCYYP